MKKLKHQGRSPTSNGDLKDVLADQKKIKEKEMRLLMKSNSIDAKSFNGFKKKNQNVHQALKLPIISPHKILKQNNMLQ